MQFFMIQHIKFFSTDWVFPAPIPAVVPQPPPQNRDDHNTHRGVQPAELQDNIDNWNWNELLQWETPEMIFMQNLFALGEQFVKYCKLYCNDTGWIHRKNTTFLKKGFLSELFFAHLLALNQERTLAEKDQDYYARMCEITIILGTTEYCQKERVQTSWKFIYIVCFVERLTLIILLTQN